MAFKTFAGGIAPDYAGGSVGNLPATIVEHLAGERPAEILPPLSRSVLPPESLEDVDRIVLVVVDGLGSVQLQRALGEGRAPTIAALRERGSLRPMTSVLPSTTVTALASMSSGLGARGHGLTGYRTFLPRVGATFNLIHLRPLTGGPDLFQLGYAPEAVFPFETLMGRLGAAGVAARMVTRATYMDSPLSRMLHRGATFGGYAGVGDAFARGRRMLQDLGDRRGFVEIYWDLVDTVAHAAGPESEEHDAEVSALDAALGRELVDRVKDPRTLLLLTADHGHVTAPEESVLPWNAHPEILENLTHPPSGEGRLAYLRVQNGALEQARTAVESAFGARVEVHGTRDLLDRGLFGPAPEHEEFVGRTGDLVVLPRKNHRMLYAPTPQTSPRPLIGHHGGLSEEEMLVPLLASRLG